MLYVGTTDGKKGSCVDNEAHFDVCYGTQISDGQICTDIRNWWKKVVGVKLPTDAHCSVLCVTGWAGSNCSIF